MTVEIEAKLAAWPGFELPDLGGVVDGSATVVADAVTMDALYFDAEDLRLTRAGVAVRHRSGEGGSDGTWTVKIDVGATGDDVARREEHIVPGALGELPEELRVLLRPWLRTADLVAVAHLRTDRRTTRLVVGGEVLGSVDDDEVSVLVDDHVAARFREVEVECGDEELLAAVVASLRAAGAGAPDPTPKLVRALGPRALQPPDVAPVELDEDSTAAQVLRAAIASAVLRIVQNDETIRRDGDPEGVHQARVGCRRLRSDLRTFRSLLVPGWGDPIRDELRWLAGELGAVRDLDVLREQLTQELATSPVEDRDGVSMVLDHLDRQREGAVRAALAALDSDRYLVLLDRLVEAARHPATTADADAAAAEVLPGLARAPFERLRKHVRRLPKRPTDEQLHDLRIQAKKARYAADVAVPIIGKPAKRYTKAIGGLQAVLGDLNDLSVSEAWMRDAASSTDPETAFALGVLVADRRRRRAELRGQWRSVWAEIDDEAITSWMD